MVAPFVIQRAVNFIRNRFYAKGTPLAGTTPRERFENMSIDPRQRSRFTGMSREETGTQLAGALATAIPGAGPVSRVGRGLINVGKRAYGRLYAPASYDVLKSAVKSSAVAAGGFGLVRYGITGNWRDLFSGPQAFATLLGFRVSPIAGSAGAVRGGIDVISTNVKDLANNFTNPNQTIPTFQFPDLGSFNPPDVSSQYYGAPISVDLPSSSTNVSVMGGGGGDLGLGQAILFATLAGGGLGYLFGRRKRKRKRYKARKRRK